MIASEMASRHQPMNWRDSIGASDMGHAGGVPEACKGHAASRSLFREQGLRE